MAKRTKKTKAKGAIGKKVKTAKPSANKTRTQRARLGGKKAKPQKTAAVRKAKKGKKTAAPAPARKTAGKRAAARKPPRRPVKPSRKDRAPKAAKKRPDLKVKTRKAARPKAVVQPSGAPTKEPSAAVKKLMALKAANAKPAAETKGYLIKAPKKTKQENLLSPPRFTRRIAVSPGANKQAAKPPAPAGHLLKKILSKKELDEIRLALQEERERLIAHLASLDEAASLKAPSEVNEDVPGYSIHLAEFASDNQAMETTLVQRELQAERLAEIESALNRVNQPGYGVCENCASPIGISRLRVKPFAVFCVRCRELKEQGRL